MRLPVVQAEHKRTVLLYQAGILRGSDALGTFHPDEPITRAEVAAIAVRVALPEKRISEG
ncbi:MAG: S-layer homology domain-containing protein [Oscillospiraceae bacterium]|nr:S-layer homology domain-containing protein [Oscillospiraceae bacterium]